MLKSRYPADSSLVLPDDASMSFNVSTRSFIRKEPLASLIFFTKDPSGDSVSPPAGNAANRKVPLGSNLRPSDSRMPDTLPGGSPGSHLISLNTSRLSRASASTFRENLVGLDRWMLTSTEALPLYAETLPSLNRSVLSS